MLGIEDYKQLLYNIKAPTVLGIEDLNLSPSDSPLATSSGMEANFANMNLSNKYYNYGITRCFNIILKAEGRLKLCAGSIFEVVR